MKASDLFIKQLEEEGVEYIFGLPGEENLDMLDSIRKSKKIKLIITRHEQAAAFMAANYGRLTGKAGVCLATLGPGATNLVTGVAYAQLIGAPLISISGQKAIKENWQARFQIVDIIGVMKPITKNATSIVDKTTIPTVIRNAFRTAQSERPGAVHIEFPEDVAEDTIQNVAIQKKSGKRRPVAEKKSLEKAAAMINKAKHPLIIVSSGANRNRITKSLTNFIDKTGIYVVHTQMGKGVVSDDNPYSLFATGIHKHDYVNCGIDRADCIITIGYNIVEHPPAVWNKELTKKIVNIDFVQSEPDRYYNPDIEVIGDIAHALKILSRTVTPRKDSYFKKVRKVIEEKIDEPIKNGYPLHPHTIVQSVREVMGKTDIVTFDNGIYKLWFSRLYKTFAPNTFLLDNALATMGAGLTTAMAAKLLNPDKKVLAICGDGGFMMNSQEIETALRNKINVVILVVNDNAFGFIKWKQKNMNLPSFGLDYQNPDFVKYAESYGAKGFRVEKGDDLKEVLKKAFATKGVALVECPIDYSHNYEVFSKELSNIVCPL